MVLYTTRMDVVSVKSYVVTCPFLRLFVHIECGAVRCVAVPRASPGPQLSFRNPKTENYNFRNIITKQGVILVLFLRKFRG